MGQWIRLDVDAPTHPKLLALDAEDRWRWLETLCYCGRYPRQAGRIPRAALERIGWTEDGIARLVDLALLDPGADEGWYRVHDWRDYQPMSGAERTARWRARRGVKAVDTEGDARVTRSDARVTHATSHEGDAESQEGSQKRRGRLPIVNRTSHDGRVTPNDTYTYTLRSSSTRSRSKPTTQTVTSRARAREDQPETLEPTAELWRARLAAYVSGATPAENGLMVEAARTLTEGTLAGILELAASEHVRDRRAYVLGALRRALQAPGRAPGGSP